MSEAASGRPLSSWTRWLADVEPDGSSHAFEIEIGDCDRDAPNDGAPPNAFPSLHDTRPRSTSACLREQITPGEIPSRNFRFVSQLGDDGRADSCPLSPVANSGAGVVDDLSFDFGSRSVRQGFTSHHRRSPTAKAPSSPEFRSPETGTGDRPLELSLGRKPSRTAMTRHHSLAAATRSAPRAR